MKIYEELEQLIKTKNLCLSEARLIEEQKQEELETTTAQIVAKYTELSKTKYKELSEQNAKIDSYCQALSENSIFNKSIIGHTIASLIRTMEGINYVYQKILPVRQ